MKSPKPCLYMLENIIDGNANCDAAPTPSKTTIYS